MQAESVPAGKTSFEKAQQAVSLFGIVCAIIVAVLMGYGAVTRLATDVPGWIFYSFIVMASVVAFFLTATQGTTYGVAPIGCFWNDCSWMKGRAPELALSVACSGLAMLFQAVLALYISSAWGFWVGTAFVGWVLIPHAGLLTDRWD